MAYGCGGIFLSVFIVGLILTIIEFVKAYSIFFIIGGILLILVIIVAAIVFNATQTEEFPEDVEPTYPKISENWSRKCKPNKFFIVQKPLMIGAECCCYTLNYPKKKEGSCRTNH